MPLEAKTLEAKVFDTVRAVADDKTVAVDADTVLLGVGSLLNSVKLVELCVKLEDIGLELGFEFDWTSATALSRARSMFRTAGTLAAAFVEQSKKAA